MGSKVAAVDTLYGEFTGEIPGVREAHEKIKELEKRFMSLNM